MYARASAERIILDTLRNVLEGGLHPDQAARQLRHHAAYCEGEKDAATATVATGVAIELEAGRAPKVLTLQGQTITTPGGILPEHKAEKKPVPAAGPLS